MCAHQRLLQPDGGRNQCRSLSVRLLEYPIGKIKTLVRKIVYTMAGSYLLQSAREDNPPTYCHVLSWSHPSVLFYKLHVASTP